MENGAHRLYQDVLGEVSRVIVGKQEQLRLILSAVLAEGHVLLDDLPGVGKTTLVKCLAAALGCRSRRIQFTPDLLPSDVTGMNIFDPSQGSFRRMEGPVMTNLLLADELNRAIPRTQSALLEAMEERQVTLDGKTEPLPRPFVVLATQNPVEAESTFPLPAAQTDRFMLCLSLGYPSKEEELQMLRQAGDELPLDRVGAVTGPEELAALGRQTAQVQVCGAVAEYITALVRATREDGALSLGASPRATKALYRASKALAAVSGRDFVTPDDVRQLAKPVLCHRLRLSPEAALAGRKVEGVLEELLDRIPVPPEGRALFSGEG